MSWDPDEMDDNTPPSWEEIEAREEREAARDAAERGEEAAYLASLEQDPHERHEEL